MSVSELELLNKVLADKEFSYISDYLLDENYFEQYKAEFLYLRGFYKQYNAIPDKETFSAKFPHFDYLRVSQPVVSIVDVLREEELFRKAVKVFNTSSQLFEADSNAGAQYLLAHVNELQPNYTYKCTDIIHDTGRYDEWEDKLDNKDNYFIPSGFPELDEYIFGWKRKEEFSLIISRTGTGKTMVCVKSAQHAWSLGYNVGFFSPEVSTSTLGYRFDSANASFSNTSLLRGDYIGNYKNYIEALKNYKNKFLVVEQKDFDYEATVPKLKYFSKANNLDILFIDGFDYLSDVRAEKYHSREDRLGHIAQDLVTLSIDLNIPIIGVIQANRKGTKDEDIGTEHITGADKIGASCTRLIALKANGPALQISIAKNRYGKSGPDCKVLYQWDIDRSKFFYIKQLEDIENNEDDKKEAAETKECFKQVF